MEIAERSQIWKGRLKLALRMLGRQGARIGNLAELGPPSARLISDAERELGRRIPPVLVELVTHQPSLRGEWELTEAFAQKLPAESRGVFWGRVDLSLREIVRAETSRQTWAKGSLSDKGNPYHAVWHDKFAFHYVVDGDCIAVADGDESEAVYYLSHDGGDGHGVQLATSIVDFFERWSRLAFAGPEDGLLLPFLRDASSGLDDLGGAARRWRAALELGALEGD